MWVRKERSWGGKDTFSLNRWWEWARRRLLLLISQICASHICEPKVILEPVTFSSLSSPHFEFTAPTYHNSYSRSTPKSQGPAAGSPQSKITFGEGQGTSSPLRGRGRREWRRAPPRSMQSCITGGFVYFSPLIYEIVPFTKTALRPKHNKYRHSTFVLFRVCFCTKRWHLTKRNISSRNHDGAAKIATK